MGIKCSAVAAHLEKLCPTNTAMEWDNVGLLVGDYEKEVNKVIVALDATEEVIEEAVQNGVDMIVTHHPFIFKAIKRVIISEPIGNSIKKLLKNDISLYSAHTNLDIAQGGVNDVLSQLIGLTNIVPLEITDKEKLKKLIVFVPESHSELVREALAKSGAGWISDYSDCSFMSEGMGCFRPLEGTRPFIGNKNQLEKVKEIKIETIVSEKIQSKVISQMLKVHPYEEAAYDIYPLDNAGTEIGIGRVGELTGKFTLGELADLVKNKLNINHIRVCGNLDFPVSKAAVCSGSGMSMVGLAKASQADVYITGDVKYHEAQDALSLGLNIIDAGHYETENIIVPVLKEYLKKLEGLEVLESRVNASPFKTV